MTRYPQLWPRPTGEFFRDDQTHQFRIKPRILFWSPCSYGTAHQFRIAWGRWVWFLVVRHGPTP